MLFNRRIVNDFFVFGLATYAVLWGIIEPLGSFLEDYKPEGAYSYGAMVLISV